MHCPRGEIYKRKHDSSYPFNSINWILKSSNLKLSEIDKIIFYENPQLKFKRIIKSYFLHSTFKSYISFCKAMFSWLSEKLFYKKHLLLLLKRNDENFDDKKKIVFVNHHFSHASSAFYPSPYDEALILTADGVGEFATTSVAIGKNKIDIIKEIHFRSRNALFIFYVLYWI